MLGGLDQLFDALYNGVDIPKIIRLYKGFSDEKQIKTLLENQKKIISILDNKRRDDSMKLLKDLIEKADDTLDEIEWYAEKAHHLKADHRQVADTYIRIAEMHVTIYNMLHERMVETIEEYKRQGHTPPATMTAIWEYEHEKLVKEFAEAKYLIEEYKKS